MTHEEFAGTNAPIAGGNTCQRQNHKLLAVDPVGQSSDETDQLAFEGSEGVVVQPFEEGP